MNNFDSEDEFNDSEDFSYIELNNDLKNVQTNNLRWLMEEFSLQFDFLLDEISDRNNARLYELAKKLTPYFVKSSSDENQSIREFAKSGLEQIKERFPELIKQFSEKTL